MIELDIECAPATASEDMLRVDRLREALANRDQLMSQVRTHLRIKAPEPNQVKLPTLCDRFNHTRIVDKSTQRFSTIGRGIPPRCRRDFASEPNPFRRLNDEDFLRKVYRRTNKSNRFEEGACFVRKLCKKPCDCKSILCKKGARPGKKDVVEMDECEKINRIAARIRVEDAVLPTSAIDVDPEYFANIKGRPIRDRFNKNDFVKNQRVVFFKKLFAGYVQDGVKKRQEQHKLDTVELARIDKELDKVKKSLETFVNQSHAESVTIVREQMEINKIRENKEEELRKCKIRLSEVKNLLYKRDDVLSTSLNARDLLLRISPTDYRAQYEEEVKKNRQSTEKLAEKVNSLFDDYCRQNPNSEPDVFLEEVVRSFVKQLHTLGPPKIYFKHKWEIDVVFRKIELQCIDQMGDLALVERLLNEIDGLSKNVDAYCGQQIDVVRRQIERFELSSEYENRRAVELENAANDVVTTSFKQSHGGDVVVEILALVQILFEYIVGPSNAKFDPCDMMVLVEEELRKVHLQIQELREKGFSYYEDEVEEKMKNEIVNANKAKERNREIRAAIYRVKNLYTKPPTGPGWRKLVNRTEPLQPKKRIKVVTCKEDKRFEHMQLEGIWDREDVEEDVDRIIVKLVQPSSLEIDHSPSDAVPEAQSLRSSLRSSVDSDSIERAVVSLYDDSNASEEESQSTLSVVQLDYDSNEELLVKNQSRRKLSTAPPQADQSNVLYDTLNINSRFMVQGKRGQLVNKDKRHEHKRKSTGHQLGGL